MIDVRLEGLTKVFGSVNANQSVSIHIKPGTIHGLVGENGAGKSTAMKMLYGLYAPTSGKILIDGAERSFASPIDAVASGIGMVHQHFMLAEPYTVLDNIILGAEAGHGGQRSLLRSLFLPINRSAAATRISEIARNHGLDVPLTAKVETLPVGVQQRIEILKLLYRDARLLILDEPTAVLNPIETKQLFANLRKLRDEGHSIVIITHKLEEVMALTDEVTVMRAGRVVGNVQTSSTTMEALAGLMVGREVNLRLKVAPAKPSAKTVLKVTEFGVVDRLTSAKPVLDGINLQVHSGEIVGVAGVEGNGQRELFAAIAGFLAQSSRLQRRALTATGKIQVLDQYMEPGSRLARGSGVRGLKVAVVPFDRHREGLLLSHDAVENCFLGFQRQPVEQNWGVLHRRHNRLNAENIFASFDVRPRDTQLAASSFSGGNQQKLIIGREMARNPEFVLAANPIRGVDVGAIEAIHQQLVSARDRGAGVLLFSSDLDEILTLSDRLIVMYEGRIVGEFNRGSCTLEQLGLLMGGGQGS